VVSPESAPKESKERRVQRALQVLRGLKVRRALESKDPQALQALRDRMGVTAATETTAATDEPEP
jgi:hypothetical protein